MPIIVCSAHCSEVDALSMSYARLRPDVARGARVRRTGPLGIARACVAGMRSVLEGSEFFEPGAGDDSGRILSGPEPISEPDLIEYARTSPLLRGAPPRSAEDYAGDVADLCADLFTKVTGGPMPLLSCEMEFEVLQP